MNDNNSDTKHNNEDRSQKSMSDQSASRLRIVLAYIWCASPVFSRFPSPAFYWLSWAKSYLAANEFRILWEQLTPNKWQLYVSTLVFKLLTRNE